MKSFAPALLIWSILITPPARNDSTEVSSSPDMKSLWTVSGLREDISFDIFKMAMEGHKQLSAIKKNHILTIIDYSKASTEKRFFVIDLNKKELLYKTYVAHGRNTGVNYAEDFSNKPGSKKSSLGFYTTAETYYGKHGFSLRLDGLEDDFNGNARNRAIVIHGAEYVSDEFISKYGRLGRSWGCPALPENQSKEIIQTIKEGSGLFIYAENENYLRSSRLLGQ